MQFYMNIGNKGLHATNKTIRNEILRMVEGIDPNRLFRVSDHVLDRGSLRLDCGISTDVGYRAVIGAGTDIYYFQFQAGSETYANVCCADLPGLTVQDIYGAVKRSLEHSKCIYMVPNGFNGNRLGTLLP